MWTEVQNDTFIEPDEVTEEYYNKSKLKSCALKGFIGFGMSFSGKFYSGYTKNIEMIKRRLRLQKQRTFKKIKTK